MVNPQAAFEHVISLLDAAQVEYKLFEHRTALSYEELAAVQREAGFFGTEAKCLVMRAEDRFIVYVTLQGRRLNFARVAEVVGVKKLKLAGAIELKEYFGAEPGCAYPFGFAEEVAIYVDPEIFAQEWLLFSPVLPTRTVQARGRDMQRVFANLPNNVEEVSDFNQV